MVPILAFLQDAETRQVLMLGYMNQAAFDQTISSKKVTFFSRSKQRLWVKGETSGNFLHLLDWSLDCDNDTLLVRVRPEGPTCHKGTDTCWGEDNAYTHFPFIAALEQVIADRKSNPTDESYTTSLFEKGTGKIAQKVGEEAVELVIEAMSENNELFLEEAADLLFHFLILLADQGHSLNSVVKVLEDRRR